MYFKQSGTEDPKFCRTAYATENNVKYFSNDVKCITPNLFKWF